MALTQQHQILNKQVTTLQHQLQSASHANPTVTAMHREVVALKNDIAAGKNSVVLNERMKRINTMLQTDQRTSYRPPMPQAHYQQQGRFGNPASAGAPMPAHNNAGHFGPAFSHSQSSHLQYGLRQMSATLNQHPKF